MPSEELVIHIIVVNRVLNFYFSILISLLYDEINKVDLLLFNFKRILFERWLKLQKVMRTICLLMLAEYTYTNYFPICFSFWN